MHIPSYRVVDRVRGVVVGSRERRVLGLLGRFDRRFGRMRWAATLAGEPSGLVYEFGLNNEPEFGLLERAGLKAAYGMLDRLEKSELVRTVDFATHYRVLELTDAGRRVIGRAPAATGAKELGFAGAQEQAAFDALVARRNVIAARTGRLGSQVARLKELRELVLRRPGSAGEVAAILSAGAGEGFGVDALEVLQAMAPPESYPEPARVEDRSDG
jgi:hypothetical protein